MADQNIIPSINAAGSFEAITPFDKVVKQDVYYTVEQITTIRELKIQEKNLYSKMFAPLGVSEADYPTILNNASAANAVVVILTSKNASDVYVLTNYLKSFPLVDGVAYENLMIVGNLGAVPPSLKNVCNTLVSHLSAYIKANLGIQSPTVFLASAPTRGYVTREQADVFETTRLNSIQNSTNDVTLLNKANAQIDKLTTYVQELESKLELLAQNKK